MVCEEEKKLHVAALNKYASTALNVTVSHEVVYTLLFYKMYFRSQVRWTAERQNKVFNIITADHPLVELVVTRVGDTLKFSKCRGTDTGENII